ncbi:hypothetical protein DET65_3214 [Sunxiuqinia elliptica]|uniref:Uncharacterized protein n=1 Tax=Sunxiuqinia elliptica TaxID=655355 RepID=A0A1I2M3L5_9BACT|nr:hypothetical protein DET52_10438 [Sunxiuqinia elliptica]TDO58689.1 hypothetical protein DET65_3214 [Sunxiuqinia elliptica]SFF85428.1 hypothetical protein SAMN05216283_11821 [Sunxiuqinia elliptica]
MSLLEIVVYCLKQLTPSLLLIYLPYAKATTGTFDFASKISKKTRELQRYFLILRPSFAGLSQH